MTIHRRVIFQVGLTATVAAVITAALPRQAYAVVAGERSLDARTFEVTTEVDLGQPGEAAQLWLPVFQSTGSYQKVLGVSWDSNAEVMLERDPVYGARLLHARWGDAPVPQRLKLVQRVATWERSPLDASEAITEAERAFWLRPSPGVPTDGIVRDTARRIIGDRREPKAQLRAIYDWVVANTWRDEATPGCGTGNIATMLQSQHLGGKCVDINSLLVGLCRAAGIPARDVYGIRLANSTLYKSLGRSGAITGAQHCRAEVYLEQEGWFAVDPADVRKAILEDNLPPDSPAAAKLADRLFGAWESNWAGYNSATGIALEDAPHKPTFDFMMYPCAMSAKSSANCLDAAHFAYQINSAEITT